MTELIGEALHKEVRHQLDPSKPLRFERRAQTFLLFEYLNELSDRPEVVQQMHRLGITSLLFTVLGSTLKEEILQDLPNLVDLMLRVLSGGQDREIPLDYHLILGSFHTAMEHLVGLSTESPDALDCINEILVLTCMVVNHSNSHDAFLRTGLLDLILVLSVPEYKKESMVVMKKARIEQAFETKLLLVQIITALASGQSQCVRKIYEVRKDLDFVYFFAIKGREVDESSHNF